MQVTAADTANDHRYTELALAPGRLNPLGLVHQRINSAASKPAWDGVIMSRDKFKLIKNHFENLSAPRHSTHAAPPALVPVNQALEDAPEVQNGMAQPVPATPDGTATPAAPAAPNPPGEHETPAAPLQAPAIANPLTTEPRSDA